MILTAIRSRFSPIWSSLPAALLVAGAVIRIAGIGAGALWYDEAYSMTLITRFDPITMIRWASLDFNPPLWELIAWPFVRLLGPSEISLRLPALIASLVSLWLAWRLMELFIVKPAQRVAAALLIALLPIGFWTAQDGRCYALMTALYLGQLYAARRYNWPGVAICTALLLYAHNTGVFYALSGLAAAWLMTSRRLQKPLVIAGGIGGLLFVPYLPFLLQSTDRDFWLEPLTMIRWNYDIIQSWFVGTLNGRTILLGLGNLVLNVSIMLAALFTFVPVISSTVPGWMVRIGRLILQNTGIHQVISSKLARRDPKPSLASTANSGGEDPSPNLALAVFALGPIWLMILCGLVYKPVLFYRPLVPAVIPLCLWFAAVLTPRRLTITTWILPYSWLILLVAGLLAWSPMIKGGELRSVADLVNAQLQPGDVIYHATATSYLPASFYLSQPGYLLNERQPDGLLQRRLQDAFGIPRAALEDIEHERVWLFWSRDPMMTDRATNRMQAYTAGAQLVAVIHYWQAAPIEVYLSE